MDKENDIIIALAIIGCFSCLGILAINAIGTLFNVPTDPEAGHSWTETSEGWKNYDRCCSVCNLSMSSTEFYILTEKRDYHCRCTIINNKHNVLFEQTFYFRE